MSRLTYKAEKIRSLVTLYLNEMGIRWSSRDPMCCAESVGYFYFEKGLTINNMPAMEGVRIDIRHSDAFDKLHDTLFIHGDPIVGEHERQLTSRGKSRKVAEAQPGREIVIFAVRPENYDLLIQEVSIQFEKDGHDLGIDGFDLNFEGVLGEMFSDYSECPEGFYHTHYL